jgi:hypothetical protein
LLGLAAVFPIYAQHRFALVPAASWIWMLLAAGAALSALAASVRAPPRMIWLAVSLLLGWQGLLGAFSELPARSTRALVRAVQPAIHAGTELFTVGQYRESLSPYLQRTLVPVDFQGELAFGLSQSSQPPLSHDEFLRHWNASHDAVAFIHAAVWPAWRAAGLAGRIIGADRDTVVLSRS